MRDRHVIQLAVEGQVLTGALAEARAQLASESQERARIESELSRIQAALDDATDAIMVADKDGTVSYINLEFASLFHTTLDMLNESGWATVVADNDVPSAILASIEAGDSWTGQAMMRSCRGTEFPGELRAAPIVNDAIEVDGLLLMIRDITERKRLEQKLLNARKLESIGQLASGVAHEINTPTQYIGDNTRFVKKAFSKLTKAIDQYEQLLEAAKAAALMPELTAEVDKVVAEVRVAYLREEIPDALDEAIEGIDRVGAIVQAMKQFSHPGVAGATETDINAALESTILVARNEWKYVADVDMDLDRELPPVCCAAGELNQVILNLLVNAAHAIKDVVGDGISGKGRITVRTRLDGDWVEIQVADTGVGIPEDVQLRIFDPFFTTKGVGQGTGQGLSIAHSVITEKHGGTLTVDSKPGDGTTFTIRLPLCPAMGDLQGAHDFIHVP